MNSGIGLFVNQALQLLLIALLSASLNAYSADEDHAEDHVDDHATEHETEHAKATTGPNGGKLLLDDDVGVELAIIERGTGPEYHAWITRGGKAAANPRLEVTLTRLGGREDVYHFSKKDDYWRGDAVVAEPHSFDVLVELQLDGRTHRWQWESHEGRVDIAADIANTVGIVTAIAGAGTIERHLQVYGRLVTPPDQKVQIRARFPGVATAVRVNVGDRVSKGDVLAVIESNESLQSYELRAPIAGVIQSRAINVGEMAVDSPLFNLISTASLWAELKVFSGQRAQVKPGQVVHVEHNTHTHETQATHITSTEGGSPFVLARAVLNNDNGDMAPGDLVSAQIDVETIAASLTVDNRALQSINDATVVFVKVGDSYEARPLELGASDGRFTEVLGGLDAGDHYVVENSFLIKADIEKSGASHDH